MESFKFDSGHECQSLVLLYTNFKCHIFRQGLIDHLVDLSVRDLKSLDLISI